MFCCDLLVGTSAATSRISPQSPTSPQQAPAAPRPAQQPQRASFPEATIQRLMSLGFARAQVIEELTRSNGDADQALASLFAKSFQLP